MDRYTIRVELHDADEEDYETLRGAMEETGPTPSKPRTEPPINCQVQNTIMKERSKLVKFVKRQNLPQPRRSGSMRS